METITIFTTGSARGNPGPAAIGVHMVAPDGKLITELSEKIGNATDTFAHYHAIMRGLQIAKEHFGARTTELHVELKLDSELVKKQLNAESEINDPGLVPYFIQIHNMRVSSFPTLTFTHIERELNIETGRLVNEAFDAA